MGLDAAAYARMLGGLLPRGRWRRVAGAVLQAVLLGSADELVRVDGRAAALIEESDPRTTSELLPDFERVLKLPGTGTVDQRRAKVVARLLRRQRFRPADFQAVLAPVLGLASAAVVVLERTAAFAASVGDAREIFRFFVYRNPALGGSYDVAAAQAIVDDMKPSHTKGYVIESVNFLCDDPFSLCDRDLLGV